MALATDRQLRRRLKLRDLDTLIAVSQSGSMAKAAALLSLSQPAVSKAMAELEGTLGVPLFDRTSQGVVPTAYGRALLKWSAAVFDDVRQGVNEIEFLADPGTGELRIGASEPMLVGVLPAILDRLSRRYPRMSFQIAPFAGTALQQRDLLERRIDLAIGRVQERAELGDFHTEILFDEPLLVVAGRNNPLVRRRRVTFAEIADEPWTLPRPETLAGQMIADAFRANGAEPPRSGIVCNSVGMHFALLDTGRFLAMFPGSLLRFGTQGDSISVLPVDLGIRAEPVGISTLKNRTLSPAAQIFVECARDVVKPLTRRAGTMKRAD
ncbi:MAG TPA: LysR family transcriptional regulator [Pseudolabrys sp.]|nr:LysR family transcriptional regulator [Pseudolabrys sp.]